MLGTLRRYLKIINHIVTHVARRDSRREREKDEERRETQATGLHGLIWHLNQFPVINYGLCPFPTTFLLLLLSTSASRRTLPRPTTMTALLSAVLQCGVNKIAVTFSSSVIINNYLPKCESQVGNACALMGADITRKLAFRCNKHREFCPKNGK